MIKVWDGFIRFFHVSLIVLIVTLYISAENDALALHLVCAYTLLALMITRLIWGIIGSDTAKLSALIHSPKAAITALKTAKPHVGHNPAGSYMVIIFFALIFSQLISGLMSSDDVSTQGPLVAYINSKWVELASDWHHSNFELLLIAIVVHISAIIIYQLRGKALAKAMVSGYQNTDLPAPQLKSPWLGVGIFVLLTGLLMWLWGAEPLRELLA